jgi:hypothetical protein
MNVLTFRVQVRTAKCFIYVCPHKRVMYRERILENVYCTLLFHANKDIMRLKILHAPGGIKITKNLMKTLWQHIMYGKIACPL